MAVAAVLALAPGTAAGAALVRIGRAPSLPAGTVPLAAVAGGTRIRISLALEPRDPAALGRYAQAVSEPSSSSYRDYLTPRAFARRFAPRIRRVRAVDAWLRSHGLSPGRLSANGLSIPVTASASAVERAFSTTLAAVRLPHTGDATVNTEAPALGARVASTVQAVIGLSSLNHQSSDRVTVADPSSTSTTRAALEHEQIDTGGPEPCPTAVRDAPPQSAYTADQIASAYGLSGMYATGDEGAGVTVVVYELEPVDPADLAVYQRCYGTDTSISYVEVDGGVRPGPGSGEAALDIEQLIGLVPKARLIVYQAPNSNANGPGAGPYDELDAIISQDRGSVISNSWGQCEPEEGSTDAAAENVLFEEAAIQGQSVLASSGDSGAQDCNNDRGATGSTALEVDDPASQPYVTGVGGTALSAIGPPPTESAWNDANDVSSLFGQSGAGGGGVSSFWPMPAYQSTAPAALGVTSSLSSGVPCHAAAGDCREVPDVSAGADPNDGYLIYYNGSGAASDAASGWQGTGGTSAAAPLWAAVIALADADPACGGASVGFVNPALYQLAATSPDPYFHDVTTGDNDLTGTSGSLYPAGPGYDMATGLGSPEAATLVPALCAATLRLAGPRSELTFTRNRVSVPLDVAAPSGNVVRYRVHGLPAGLALNLATGTITGRVGRLGHYRVSVEAIDTSGTVRRIRFGWTVADRTHVSERALRSAAGATTSLSISATAGKDEPQLHSLTVELPAGLSVARRHTTAIAVTNAAGRRLGHRASVLHGALTITLRSASSDVRLVFAGDALLARRGLQARIDNGHAGRITVISDDVAGGSVTAKLRVLPSS